MPVIITLESCDKSFGSFGTCVSWHPWHTTVRISCAAHKGSHDRIIIITWPLEACLGTRKSSFRCLRKVPNLLYRHITHNQWSFAEYLRKHFGPPQWKKWHEEAIYRNHIVSLINITNILCNPSNCGNSSRWVPSMFLGSKCSFFQWEPVRMLKMNVQHRGMLTECTCSLVRRPREPRNPRLR